MPNITDAVGADVERKFMDLVRILFQMFRDFSNKAYDAASKNDSLQTYYNFMKKLEKHYDLETGEIKEPGKRPPFDVSKCSKFATKEILDACKKARIDCIMVSHERLGTLMVTPSDDETRNRLNAIKTQMLIDNAYSARMTSAELFADNAGRDIVCFEGFTATQVAEFEAYAKEQKFMFAAPQNENGTYTIEVSKFTAEQPAFRISEKIQEMSAFNSKGLEATLDSMYSKRKAMVIDNIIADMRATGSDKAPEEKVYVVDAKNPTHYVAVSGDHLTIASSDATTAVKGEQAEQEFFNEVNDMQMPVHVTESQFKALYAQDALSPEARMKFAKESYSLTKAEMNGHLLSTMEQRLNEKKVDFDLANTVTAKMKNILEQSENAQDKRLLEQMNRVPVTDAQIRSMLENGDSIRSGCTNDISLGRNFNDAFNKAVESIVAEQVKVERTVKDILKESKEVNLSDITPEQRDNILKSAGIEDAISVAMAEHMMDDISERITNPTRPEMVRATLEAANRDIQDIIDAAEDYSVGDSTTHFNNEPSVQFSI